MHSLECSNRRSRQVARRRLLLKTARQQPSDETNRQSSNDRGRHSNGIQESPKMR
jgi:hypothetical protein